MRLDDILSSNALKERFIRDSKISIGIKRNPYFFERLQLLETLYPDIMDKWNTFVEDVSKYDTDQDYLEYYNSVKDKIIDYVKGTKGYKNFNEIENPEHFDLITRGMYIPIENMGNYPKKDIFKPSNDGKMFLSIDMVKANFSVLSFYDKEIFDGADTWEEFVSKFTDSKHIISSKYIREVVLGNCNPKRHIQYEKRLMAYFVSKIIENGKKFPAESNLFGNIESHIAYFSNDEVILDVSGYTNTYIMDVMAVKNPILDTIESMEPLRFRMEAFLLSYIKGLDGYLEWNIINNEITTKCFSSQMLPFLCRGIRNENVKMNDLAFIHPNLNNILCEIREIPDFKIPQYIINSYERNQTLRSKE